MPCAVVLSGALEPIEIVDDFAGVTNDMLMASAQRQAFVATRRTDGTNVLIHMDAIVTITELEDSDDSYVTA